VDETISLLKADFEVIFEDGSGAMQVRRGRTHVYVGMTLDYTYAGQAETEKSWANFQSWPELAAFC
jgi:hypothetical protein